MRPPITTLRSGLRAAWVKLDGAVAQSRRARPRGRRTRSPWTSAPASFQSASAPGIVDEVHADLGKHGLGVRLDDLERLGVQDLEVGDLALDEAGRLEAYRGPLGPARSTAPAPFAFTNLTHRPSFRLRTSSLRMS